MNYTIVLMLFLCFANVQIAWAQSDTLATATPSGAAAARDNPRLKTPITLVAKDANLSEILKVLADRSGMNFVSGEGVYKEKVTLVLNKTPLDEAINIVVRAVGLSYEIIGNSVLVAEPAKLKDEVGLSGYVIDLKYAPAAEVAAMLADLTTKVKVDEGGNRLVCYTSPRILDEIYRIVKAVDHPHILVMLETRLVEVNADNLRAYGLDWNALSPVTSSISYPATHLAQGINFDQWTHLPVNFNIILDLMASKGDAKILMDSKLTTTNNREAKLMIGDVIPYIIQSYNLTTGGAPSQQIQKEEVGVKITMTPHINEDNQITLALAPEVSSIVGYRGTNADLPLIRVRKTQTTVRVESGQTVFLAGLLQDETTTEIRKLPILGDLPIIGFPFQHKKTITKRTNLIIEITPRIITDPKEIASQKLSIDSLNAKSKAMAEQIKIPLLLK